MKVNNTQPIDEIQSEAVEVNCEKAEAAKF